MTTPNTESVLEEATEIIEAFVAQDCGYDAEDRLDSMAISTYADGLRWLAERGRVEIVSEHGRRVIARWVQNDGSGPLPMRCHYCGALVLGDRAECCADAVETGGFDLDAVRDGERDA